MNVEKLREDFPVLKKGIIYFDSSCMTLKPKQVIAKMDEYYNDYPACAGRSVHKLSVKVGEETTEARKSVQKLVNARKPHEIIFTRNTTEAINLVSNSFKFEKVLISDREHNSNLLPWQKFKYGVLRSKEDFSFDLEKFSEAVKKYDFVSFPWVGNFDGYTLPVKEIVKIAHENKAKVHLDAAQALPHKEVNAKKLDVDFFSFSGHKMLGPSGMGGLYGKEELLKEMKPFLIGGDTVKDSNYNGYVLEDLPNKFEAGLQNYAGILGMGAASKYLMDVGVENIQDHEAKLTKEVNRDGIVQVGNKDTIGVFNFNIPGMDHHEVAGILDSSKNIAIRSGMHCAHAWYNEHKIKGSARASFYLYNTVDEIKILNEELGKIKKLSS